MLAIRRFPARSTDSEDLQEQVTRLRQTVESYQDWGKRSDERLSKLETAVASIQASVGELTAKCKLLDMKFKVQKLREERLEMLALALERFFDDNGAESEGPSTPRRAGSETPRRSGQASLSMFEPSTPRRSERKRNLEKLMATEKCQPDLDFPERVKTPVKTTRMSADTSTERIKHFRSSGDASVERTHGGRDYIGLENFDGSDDTTIAPESENAGGSFRNSLSAVDDVSEESEEKGQQGNALVQNGSGDSKDQSAVLKKQKFNGRELVVDQNRQRKRKSKNKSLTESTPVATPDPMESVIRDGGNNSFACSTCNQKGFSSKIALESHERMHVKKIKCKYCVMVYNHPQSLIRHIQKCHKLNVPSSSESTTGHLNRSKPQQSKKTPENDSASEPASRSCSPISEPSIAEHPSENTDAIKTLSTQQSQPSKLQAILTGSNTEALITPPTSAVTISPEPSRNKRKQTKDLQNSLAVISPELPPTSEPWSEKRKKLNTGTKSHKLAASVAEPVLYTPADVPVEESLPSSIDDSPSFDVHECPVCSKSCRSIRKLEKHLVRKH